MLTNRAYSATAQIIEDVQNLMDVFTDKERYTPAAKKLAAKILLEWSKDLKRKHRRSKKPKKGDIQMAALLEGYAKFLT